MRATSSGTVKLKSRNPKEHPIIDPNYLATGLFLIVAHLELLLGILHLRT